jgi:osmotically-inducible protein OsmY
MDRLRKRITGPARLGSGRNDGDIFGEARTALDRRPDVPAAIHVHVADGVVTLTGTVQHPGERSAAEEVVTPLKGVRQVDNRVTVAHVLRPEEFDPEIR